MEPLKGGRRWKETALNREHRRAEGREREAEEEWREEKGLKR